MSTWFLLKMGPPPVVTGVSPKEGPPGTRVTIRGENLGYGPDDITGVYSLPVIFKSNNN